MSKLKQAQGQMQEEYKREINGKPILNASIADFSFKIKGETKTIKLSFLCCWSGLNKQIEDNKKEILLLKTNCDQSTQLSKLC